MSDPDEVNAPTVESASKKRRWQSAELLTGVVLGALMCAPFFFISLRTIIDEIKSIAAIAGITAVGLIIGLIVFRLLMPWIVRRFLDSTPAMSLRAAVEAGSSGKIGEMLGEVVSVYSWITLRQWAVAAVIAAFGVFAAVAGTVLLVEQNQLLEKQLSRFDSQNALLEDQISRLDSQNKLLRVQTSMQDSARVVNYSAEVTRVIKEIYLETRGDENSPLALSENLISDINSLLIQLSPYTYIDSRSRGQDIQTVFLSPEKGYILRALLENNVQMFQLGTADFSFADMRGVNLSKVLDYLSYSRSYDFPCSSSLFETFALGEINLSGSDWSGALLTGLEFSVQSDMVLEDTTIAESAVTFHSSVGLNLINSAFVNSKLSFRVPFSLDALNLTAQLDYLRSPCLQPADFAEGFDASEVKLDLAGLSFSFYGNADGIDGDLAGFDWDSALETYPYATGNKSLNPILSEIYRSFTSGTPINGDFIVLELLSPTASDDNEEYIIESWRDRLSKPVDGYLGKVTVFDVDEIGNVSINIEIESSN